MSNQPPTWIVVLTTSGEVKISPFEETALVEHLQAAVDGVFEEIPGVSGCPYTLYMNQEAIPAGLDRNPFP
jgi:hypothetical protein